MRILSAWLLSAVFFEAMIIVAASSVMHDDVSSAAIAISQAEWAPGARLLRGAERSYDSRNLEATVAPSTIPTAASTPKPTSTILPQPSQGSTTGSTVVAVLVVIATVAIMVVITFLSWRKYRADKAAETARQLQAMSSRSSKATLGAPVVDGRGIEMGSMAGGRGAAHSSERRGGNDHSDDDMDSALVNPKFGSSSGGFT